MLTRSPKRRTGRDDSGETLVSVIVAMVITGLVMPAVLHMIYVTAQMAAAQPVHDSAVAATSQLQSMLAEIDPVRVCLSPAGTGRRDQCLTTSDAVGASLVQPPPDALGIDPMTICWLARPDNPDTPSPQIESGLKTQCLMLRDDGNDTPFAPNARRETSETDRQISAVDPRGGDELIVRTYDIAVPPGGDPAAAADPAAADPENYLLPVAGAQSWADQVIYFDAEWWCLRWRHPKDDSADGAIVGRWIGNCPCPADTFEQIPLPATVETLTDPDSDVHTVHWVPPPAWADTDGTLTPGLSPDDGDPYDNVAELASPTGTCDRVAATRSDGTVNPDHCDASATVGALPGVPILSGPPGDSGDCDTDAWWNPRYSSEAMNLRGYLLPAAAVPGAGDGPPLVLSRVASMEIGVCVATTIDTRNRGGAHCEMDTMRFALPGFDGLSTSSTPSPVTLSLSLSALSILENTSGHLTVTLTAPPTGPVTVTVASADTATATVSPTTLTFTAINYNTPQSVTIDGVVDADALDDTTTVTLTAAGGGYSAVMVTVPVTITEVQPPALIVTGSATLAENTTDTFTVELATAPTGSVIVTVASADTATATASPPTLTFTTADYTAQTVTVTGVHDPNTVTDTTTVELTAAGADYDTITDSMPVTVTDIDAASLVVTPLAVAMDENATDTFTVELATAPTGGLVTVTATSADTAAATVSPPTLTFATTDYNTPKTMIVSGVADTDTADDATTVTITAAGGGYDTAAPVSVAVTVTDTDIGTATLIVTGPVAMDENATDTFTVKLAAAPTGPVTVTITSADTATATVSGSLAFTAADHNTAQTVTVTGTHDTDAADDTTSVALSASGGGYDTITASVAVTVTDIDPMATNRPGTPINVMLTCTAAGATITWDAAPGGQPTIYEVDVTFWGRGEEYTQFVSDPTTTADLNLGNGYYGIGVRAHNSAGGSNNFGLVDSSC